MKARLLAALLFVAAVPIGGAFAQSPPAATETLDRTPLDFESLEPSVVVLALGDGSTGWTLNMTQLAIARAALETSNVVLLSTSIAT
jgi:hypothetical protein